MPINEALCIHLFNNKLKPLSNLLLTKCIQGGEICKMKNFIAIALAMSTLAGATVAKATDVGTFSAGGYQSITLDLPVVAEDILTPIVVTSDTGEIVSNYEVSTSDNENVKVLDNELFFNKEGVYEITVSLGGLSDTKKIQVGNLTDSEVITVVNSAGEKIDCTILTLYADGTQTESNSTFNTEGMVSAYIISSLNNKKYKTLIAKRYGTYITSPNLVISADKIFIPAEVNKL